jgi:phosphopantothenoylcysteine decarboxylase/phosphopantothenate--cysteine ligase
MVAGFAAETENLEAHALAKLRDKGVDLIAANDVAVAGQGFESDDNALLVLGEGLRHEIARGSKTEVARALLLLVAERLGARP